MLLSFKNHLQIHFPALLKDKSLLAISGGIDSVVLTHLCKKINLNIALAHCNFNLREAESDADEAFVRKLAADLQLDLFVEHFDTNTFAEEHKISIQMAARELRYAWFENLRKREKFDCILTAHHANDDLETFIINFVRGTGLNGLTGIPAEKDLILRPLLPFSRAAIEKYAEENELKWREDSSNASTKYLRNKIRHDVVPVLEELNPQLLESFQKTQQHLKQSSNLIEDYISAIFSRVAKESKYGYSFNIKMLKSIPHTKAVLYELFKSFGFTEWDDVFHLLDAQPGKMVFSKTHRLIKDREELLLTTLPSEAVPAGRQENEIFEISVEDEVLILPIGTFHIGKVETISEDNTFSIFVDKDKLKFPLQLRKWKKGDVFYPFGMEGKKKLSKYFKDIKLSLPEKENCWLLCSEGQIIWVVGHRADNRFAVGSATSEILKITYIL